MRVVVTGAAGFIGSHVVERLVADGHVVVGLDDLSTGEVSNLAAARRQKRFTLHHFDVTSALIGELLAREVPDVVVHLAPVLPVALLVARPQRFVLASAASVYGAVTAAVTERRGLRPATFAGAHHVAAEAYLQASASPGVALRLATVYGPRSRGAVTTWARALLAGKPTYVRGDGRVVRDLVHVDDVVDAVVRCLGGKADGRRLNIGSGTGTTARALHSAVAAAVGVPDAPEFAPAEPEDLASTLVDPSAARRALGWEPTVGLSAGLARTVDALRKH